MAIQFTYKSIGSDNIMLAECPEAGKNIDTQVRMLCAGGLNCFLPTTPTSKNGMTILQYKITGLTQLAQLVNHGKLNRTQFQGLIDGYTDALEECSAFALLPCGIYLQHDAIYFDTRSGRTIFTYIPTMNDTNHVEQFREYLRALMAYGKVEHNAYTAAVTDVINGQQDLLSTLRGLRHMYAGPDRQPNVSVFSQSAAAVQPMAPAPQVTPPSPYQAPHMPQTPPVSPAPTPMQHSVEKGNSPAGTSAMNFPKSSAISAKKTKKNNPDKAEQEKDTGNNRNKSAQIKKIAIVVLSIALGVGSIFTSAVRTADGGLDVTKVIGIVILLGALDFLLLRKKTEDGTKQETQKEPRKASKLPGLPAMPSTGKNSNPKPPLPTPVSAKAVPAMPVQAPAMSAPAMPVQAPVMSAPPAPPMPVPPAPQQYSAPSSPSSADTVLFDDSVAQGILYLEKDNGQRIVVSKSPFALGRDQDTSDYVLLSEMGSRHHAELKQLDNVWYITDLNSRNHTYVNENCLPPYTATAIAPGDTVRLATEKLRLVTG